MTLQRISSSLCFGGQQQVWSHASSTTGTTMRFALFLPPQAQHGRVPAVWWLSGLTCTEENFVVKAGAQRVAAQLGLALVVPDTSPRGARLPGDDVEWSFGLGAGWYVDATQEPWARHYRMRSYLTQELRALVADAFPVDDARTAMSGHSMGGHGALTIGLQHPTWIKSLSAFAPVTSLSRCPWGVHALSRFLGDDRATWRAYDACDVVRAHGWSGPPLLVDQGEADSFASTQLLPDLLADACVQAGVDLQLRRHAGYDHGYFFVSTFLEDHLRHHRTHL